MPVVKLDRTIFKITGEGATQWLEGLITNSLKPPLTFAALLTPQGKIIADFFVWQSEDLYLETASKFEDALFKRLKMYRLRAPITIENVSDEFEIYCVWGNDSKTGTQDPRHKTVSRFMIKSGTESFENVLTLQSWDTQRLFLNLPDSEWDFESAETFPANANMDVLNGIDFKKGCYVGQEVVSRMHRKTNIRKRMCAFKSSEAVRDDTLKLGGRVVGDVMHRQGQYGMAMVRYDRLGETSDKITCGSVAVSLMTNTHR